MISSTTDKKILMKIHILHIELSDVLNVIHVQIVVNKFAKKEEIKIWRGMPSGRQVTGGGRVNSKGASEASQSVVDIPGADWPPLPSPRAVSGSSAPCDRGMYTFPAPYLPTPRGTSNIHRHGGCTHTYSRDI